MKAIMITIMFFFWTHRNSVHSFVLLPPSSLFSSSSSSSPSFGSRWLSGRHQKHQPLSTLSSTTRASQDCSDIVDSDKDKKNNNHNYAASAAADDDDITDDGLLESVPISQFIDLCLHLNLPAEGTKEDMLLRLRKHADEQASLDRKRKLARAERVQQGFYGSGDDAGEDAYYKERYEVIDNEQGQDAEVTDSVNDEGFFYFVAPTRDTDTNNNNDNVTTAESGNTTIANTQHDVEESTKVIKTQKDNPTTRQRITAPPPPKTPNEQGERVVTVYSTSDTNDLTSYSRPGSTDNGSGGSGVLMEGQGEEPPAPWDFTTQQQQEAPKLSIELEEAKETVMELVRSLLLLSGAPAFVLEFTEGLQPLENTRLPPAPQPSREFVGFDPSLVPIDILIASSKALRAGGRRSGTSSVLHDVLHELELRAIGYDGMAGDDKSKGGGHYQQVNKIRAFLEGFRRAELRRIARETTTLLLDKLASEGIQGLDTMLATMTKSQDDSGDAGQLNDALLDFLNDMVREQSARVGDVSRVDRTIPERNENYADDGASDDELSKLWNVTSENGERIETLDPNDPVVKEAMVKEWNRDKDVTSQGSQQQQLQQLPTGAPEQLLLLLKMLRDRIKAEAAFGSDNDRGRNLRILAYCLRFDRAFDREKLLRREFQSSVDRLDTFLELVVSSIEYAESASTQLKPASSSGMLNLQLLREIMSLGRRIREEVATSRS